jgi:predicted TIM-barrel fold metal-dependent hydrolase
MKIIDTHQHLWDLDRFSFSWTKNAPALSRSFRMDDYLEATRGVELYKSVHLEADVDEPDMLGETRYILDLAERDDNPLEGVVAGARPENPDFGAYLEQIAGHPSAAKLKGLRRVLHVVPDDTVDRPGFIDNVRSLERYHLSFDICVLARQLPIALRLVRECPGIQFILDHCGNPLVKERIFEPWKGYIRELAGEPNVVCKISGIVTNADPERWTPEDLRPYVEHVVESFGWDRVMFGSDWPVCLLASGYRRWVEALMLLTAGASDGERKKLFQENAERVYRL